MISDTNADHAVPLRTEVRLRMKPGNAVRGYVDGAWWPRSYDPAMEFPGLVLAMSSWVGPVCRVGYNSDDWDSVARVLSVEGWAVRLAGYRTITAHTVIVTGPNLRRMTLLVVPPGTPGDVARAVLRSAAASDSVATVEDTLASNGVGLGRPA